VVVVVIGGDNDDGGSDCGDAGIGGCGGLVVVG